MYKINDFENDSNWKRSVGEKVNKIHFRNGHLHAECDPETGFCTIHYDEHDPNESLVELIKHLSDGNAGKVILGLTMAAVLDQVLTGGRIRNSLSKNL